MPTDIGPVDLMCRDEDDEWVAVEIKRVATIDAVEEQLPAATSNGSGSTPRAQPVAASSPPIRFKPQAVVLAKNHEASRCVEIDLEVLRGDREPELTLFAV